MIEIKISEVLYPEDPCMCAKYRAQVEMFIDGFKELCEKTGMHNITTYKLFNNSNNKVKIPTELKFDDGSSVGILRIFEEIGFNAK